MYRKHILLNIIVVCFCTKSQNLFFSGCFTSNGKMQLMVTWVRIRVRVNPNPKMQLMVTWVRVRVRVNPNPKMQLMVTCLIIIAETFPGTMIALLRRLKPKMILCT